MSHVNIPLVDKSYPSMEQVNAFLKVVADSSTDKFFVHCAGGRHRRGIWVRYIASNHDQWNFDQAYAEMKQYDFYTRNGHGNSWVSFRTTGSNPGEAGQRRYSRNDYALGKLSSVSRKGRSS